jgi:hypothetical protein
MPITVAARSKAWTVFARSNAGIVGSNPTQGMDVCIVCVYSLFVLFYVKVEAFRRADPPSKEYYQLRTGSRNWKSGHCPTKGCRAIIIIHNIMCHRRFGEINLRMWSSWQSLSISHTLKHNLVAICVCTVTNFHFSFQFLLSYNHKHLSLS